MLSFLLAVTQNILIAINAKNIIILKITIYYIIVMNIYIHVHYIYILYINFLPVLALVLQMFSPIMPCHIFQAEIITWNCH
jgi:hypothetical protein